MLTVLIIIVASFVFRFTFDGAAPITPEMQYDNYVHGGDFSDESDEDKLLLTFTMFILVGLAVFDPYLNPVEQRRIRDGAQSGAQWVIELIDGCRDRIFDNLHMEAPLFLQLCDLFA